MGNHIFIIDSEAIGKYISGLINKKFKSSREFCHRWLKENNEFTDNELKNEESIQNRANKLSQIKKGKKNIKIAQKQNLDIQFGHKELLEDFDKVMKCTEERKGISLRTKEYYELLLDTYADDAFITLAYFHIHDMLIETKERYEQCLLDLENCPENAKKKRFTLEELKDSLEKKISKYEEDVKTYGETVCVCGTLTVKYGHTSEILYAGMNEDFKRLMGPYLTWYKTMEKCFELGCKTSNMGGIEGTLKGGLVDFKEIYHPRINEYIGEFDIPVNSLLYNVAFKFYKKIKERNTKHK